jgi:protein-tyrosine phosphatase
MRNVSVQLNKRVILAVITIGVCMLSNSAFADDHEPDQIINLKGTTNTRDIGGYLTDDLSTVRYGQIIRSENLSRLTPSDFQKLEEIGVKTVIDLRTDKEHNQAPTVWVGDNPPQFHHFPVGDSQDEWFKAQRKMIKKNRFTQKQALEHMVEGYRVIAETASPSYQKLMAVALDESNWPILIHCNAGKDRAGIAVTLLLEALGVDREIIMDEFLLTNEVGRTQEKAALIAKKRNISRSGSKLNKSPSAEAWMPIVGVDAEMLEAFYASVDEQYGSMDAFLTELGVDQDARRSLAASLTTKQPEFAMGE